MAKTSRSSRSAKKPAAIKARAKPAKSSATAKAGVNGRRAVAAKAKSATKVDRKTKTPSRPTPTSMSAIVLPAGYRPAESEPFMNERHRVYFRNKLLAWKEEIVRQNRETLHLLHEDSAQHADIADRATSETDRALELRARDRQRKLIAKIDAALARIEDGSYGYCEETGEPIGLKRLDARPIATLSLEAQERHERREKVFRED
jgi:DnaK suppressor protein